MNFTAELIAMKVVSSSLKDRTGGGGGTQGGGGGICQPLVNYKLCRHSCVLVNFSTELIAMKVISSPKDRTGGGWWETGGGGSGMSIYQPLINFAGTTMYL